MFQLVFVMGFSTNKTKLKKKKEKKNVGYNLKTFMRYKTASSCEIHPDWLLVFPVASDGTSWLDLWVSSSGFRLNEVRKRLKENFKNRFFFIE